MAQHRDGILLSDTCAECRALRAKGIPRYFHKYGGDGNSQFSDSVWVNRDVVAAIRCVVRINHRAACCWKSNVSPPKNRGILVLKVVGTRYCVIHFKMEGISKERENPKRDVSLRENREKC